jgi:hypothetical protein
MGRQCLSALPMLVAGMGGAAKPKKKRPAKRKAK